MDTTVEGPEFYAGMQSTPLTEGVQEWIQTIKEMFRSTKDGILSVSAYDTAWVALIPALDGSARPQFPKCLGWILQNQLTDGSWGNCDVFLASDRMLSTLACVLALKTWNVGDANIAKGLQFCETNYMSKDFFLTTGFEIIFPALLEKAKSMELELPIYHLPIVEHLQLERGRKLKSMKDDFENGSYPMAILQSLEGLQEHVEWQKVLKQQAKNGSILFSPASTACTLMHTGDLKCLQYLNKVLETFDCAVPTLYPVDLRERLCMVDRIQRLGLSRYFQSEISEFLDYVYRHWTSYGIAWTREASFPDIDDTALAFRLLRLNGYSVSSDVFYQFKKPDGTFNCLADQEDNSQPISIMFNLLKASQTSFPGETILEELGSFTKKFLLEKQAVNKVTWDTRILVQDLPKEVDYALKYPSHATLQRLEAREYLECYGVSDAWIGKTLYRLPNVSNVTILNLAKADFNLCQKVHQAELQQLVRWNKQSKLCKIDYARQKTKELYFAIAATVFEPEMATVRLAWTKFGVLVTVLDDFFDVGANYNELKHILEAVKSWDPTLIRSCSEQGEILFMALYNTTNGISEEACMAQGQDISYHIRRMWVEITSAHLKEAEWIRLGYFPSLREYMDVGVISTAAETCLLPSLFFMGAKVTDEYLSHTNYTSAIHLVSTIFRLENDVQGYKRESSQGKSSSVVLYLHENRGATHEEALNHFNNVIGQNIKELRLMLAMQKDVPRVWKELYWNMIKSVSLFFLNTDGLSSPFAMNKYVDNVLFTLVS